MLCPYCVNGKTKVVGVVKGTVNERFRKCDRCGKTFQTVEAIKFDSYWGEYARHSAEELDQSKDKRQKDD